MHVFRPHIDTFGGFEKITLIGTKLPRHKEYIRLLMPRLGMHPTRLKIKTFQ